MRYNATGYVILHLAFNTSVHAPEKAPTNVLVHRVQEKLGRDVGELVEATGYHETELADMVIAGMSHMEIRVEGREHGDPAECDCSVCCRPCRHEPDRNTLRICADDCAEVQCKLCGEWGSMALDVPNAQFGAGTWNVPSERRIIESARAEEPSRAAVQATLRAMRSDSFTHAIREYGASEFVGGRATKPTWTASTIKDLARLVHCGISDKTQADNVALYVDGQWMGDFPMAQWQSDLCFAYGDALAEWARLVTAEEAAFEEAKKASEPSIQTCTRCNLVQPYAHTLCTDCAYNLCDPEGCECEACKIEKAEEVATGQSWEPECDHKPDYASVRSCSSKDLGCEVQCSLCNRWGAFCVDDKSVGWGD